MPRIMGLVATSRSVRSSSFLALGFSPSWGAVRERMRTAATLYSGTVPTIISAAMVA